MAKGKSNSSHKISFGKKKSQPNGKKSRGPKEKKVSKYRSQGR